MNNTNICPLLYSNKSQVSNKLTKTLGEYYKETQEHIMHYLPVALKNKKNSNKKVKNIIHYILSNDDLLSNMTTAIMLADHTHDKTRGSLRYWRTKNCIWTLNKSTYKNKIRLQNLGELQYTEPPIDNIIEKEEERILAARIDALEKREKEIYKLYFQDNLTAKKIGIIFSISQQRVNEILQSVKKKLNYE